MIEQVESQIGTRIRAIREQRKLSLQALAERCNISANAISLIERGENSPTVSSLHTLATALGVKITDFFEESHDQAVVFVPKEQRLVTDSHGLMIESLGIGLRNQQLEPGSGVDDPIVHSGQEFVFCFDGKIEYQIRNQTYHLQTGGSLLFEATQPHCFRNTGEMMAQILFVFNAIEGGHVARRCHLEA